MGNQRTRAGRGLAIAVALAAGISASAAEEAGAATPHVVQPGESLWSIAAASNFTTRTLAVFNGLPEDASVLAGTSIEIPTVGEGAAALAAAGITAGATSTGPEGATTPSSTSHLVQPGESLSSVAAANGLSVTDVAAANGLSSDAFLIEGTTIEVPASASTGSASGSTYGLGHIWSPWGELHLTPAAADSWNALRQASLERFGVDLYPDGTLSAYRTHEQQAYLYDLFLSGQGAPANPPGSSTHESGIAVDVAEPVMRDVIDQIGAAYGWVGNIPSEWWHVAYAGG